MIVFPLSFFSTQVTGSSLYTFTSFTFTNASASGHRGPTLNSCLTAYNTSSNSWLSNTSYFNVTTEGIQQWTVPETSNYDIEVAGARGGINIQASPWISGGYGAVVKTRVSLTKGDKLSIVVGQIGADRGSGPTSNFCGAAGGGGTFVYNSSSFDYYAVAGGGGGGASTRTNLLSTFLSASGKHDVTSGTTIRMTNNYTALGGTSGSGGGVSNRTPAAVLFGSAGAGVFSSGSSGKGGGSGQSRISVSGSWWGGTFNPGQSTYGVSGGFGGGAGGGASDGTTFQTYNWAGGGGGYSGGAGGGNGGASDGQYGGGGGSYYIGTFQTGSTGTNNSNGYVTITKI